MIDEKKKDTHRQTIAECGGGGGGGEIKLVRSL